MKRADRRAVAVIIDVFGVLLVLVALAAAVALLFGAHDDAGNVGDPDRLWRVLVVAWLKVTAAAVVPSVLVILWAQAVHWAVWDWARDA